MPLIARYVYNQEKTTIQNNPVEVSAWGNIAGTGLDLATAAGFDNPIETVVDTGTGAKALVETKDSTTGSKMETATTAGALTAGTIFIVGRQKTGTFQNDLGSEGWLKISEVTIGRGTGATVQAKYGANTPTFLSAALANNTVGIICFKFNASSQSLQVNNGTASTSSDVGALGLNGKLTIMYQGLKAYAEIRVYDEELTGSAWQAEYDALYETYIAAATTTVITFPALPAKNTGNADFAPGATSNSPAAITYESSNTAVATIVSGNIHIVGVGTSIITASQSATTGYTSATATRTLTVSATLNLLDYVDFTVRLDNTTGKLIVTDTSAYPTGVGAGITGFISATQPDTITRPYGTADIVYATSPTGEIELRSSANGKPQNGLYTVKYRVQHTEYATVEKTKTFRVDYTRPATKVETVFDTFTPYLFLSDVTDYAQAEWDVQTRARDWSVTAGTRGTRAGTGTTLNLAIGGVYYDAHYTGTMVSKTIYNSIIYPYLTLRDGITATISEKANTPPSFTTMRGYLKTIKERFDNLQSVRKTTCKRQDFEYAESVLDLIKQLICSGDTTTLQSQIQDFLNIYNKHVAAVYTNTNAAILPYSTADVGCGGTGSGTGGGSGSGGLTLAPPKGFKVGVTVGAPEAGSSTWTHADINTGTRLIRNGLPVPVIEWIEGEAYYTVSGTTITLHNDTFKQDDLTQI